MMGELTVGYWIMGVTSFQVPSSARVTSVKFRKGLLEMDGRTTGPIDRTPGTPGFDKNLKIGSVWPLRVFCNIKRHPLQLK